MNEKRIKVLIVDDEEPARKLIAEYLSDVGEILVTGESANGFEAIKAIQEDPPDLIFLDIQMPKITGFELLEVIGPGPEVIFTTAYDEYALKAFELDAVDYLLKPFPADRFRKAVYKAIERIKARGKGVEAPVDRLRTRLSEETGELKRVVVRSGSRLVVIPVDKISHITAEGDYVMIVSGLGNFLKETTMKFMEEKLPPDRFIRVHRSHIVNIEQVAGVEPYSKDSHLAIMKNGERVRISQEGYKKLRKIIG